MVNGMTESEMDRIEGGRSRAWTAGGTARFCGDLRQLPTPDCTHCAVRRHTVLGNLPVAAFEEVVRSVRSGTLLPAAVIYREGQPADAVYTVRRGTVKLVKRAPDGAARIVRLLGRGAAIGLEGLTHAVYWHSAVAMRSVDLCRIPRAAFDTLREGHLQVADGIVGQWEQQVAGADRWLAELTAGTVHERVLRLLVLLEDIQGADETHRIELPPMTDLADILAVSRESVSRVLAELKRDGVLRRVAPRTYEHDPNALP